MPKPAHAKIKTGLDILAAEDFKALQGARVGLLANHASVDGELRHAADLLFRSANCKLTVIFGPEHGFRGELQDMDSVAHAVDKLTQLPVYSLYGKSPASLAPTEEQLAGIDLLLVDLPDIGSRYYTFAQTLAYAMQAAAPLGKRIVVLDRPNPINGRSIEGAPLKKACRSFCGYAPVPNRHGLTIGELAKLMNSGFGAGEDAIPAIGADLQIVAVEGWKREQYHDQTGLPWVLPSVNMPTLDTAIVYPGGCLIEATGISEGRGTTRPFELLGAPDINVESWIAAVPRQGIELQGVSFRPHYFMPKFQKCAGKYCSGIQVHVRSRDEFRPFRCYLALLAALAESQPQIFSWRKDVYEFITEVPTVDILYGSSHFREAIQNRVPVSTLLPELERCEADFQQARRPFLLY